MLLRTDLDIYKYDRTGLFIMVPYITLKKGVLHDSYYGILLHAVQIRRKMFFGFLWGILLLFIIISFECIPIVIVLPNVLPQPHFKLNYSIVKSATSILHSNKFERNTDFTDHCPFSVGSTVRMVRSCENNYFPCSAT